MATATSRASRTACALLLGALLLAPTPGVAAAPDPLSSAIAFLVARQNAEGTWATPPTGAGGAYVVEAAAEAGLDPWTWPTPERPAIDALRDSSSGNPDTVYYHRLRLAHALGTAGADPRDWNGIDLVAHVLAGFRDGQYGDPSFVNDDAWAALALRAAGYAPGSPEMQAAARAVERQRHPDGGWAFSPLGTASDPDVTGMALAALAAAGVDVTGDERAFLALSRARDPLTGGYRAMPNEPPNCQSTVWAQHVLHLLGRPRDEEAHRFLLSLQQPDGGFLRHQGDPLGTNAFCTTEAVVYLAGGHYPLPGYHPAVLAEGAPHARASTALRVEGPFTDARWKVGGVALRGNPAVHTFAAKGAYAYTVIASDADHRVRLQGNLTVLSARPLLDARLSGVDVPRGVEVALDASRSVDPDGRVARLVVDWGDGNRSAGPSLRAAHAYATLANHTITAHVEDEQGFRSDAFTGSVLVRNRAPAFPPLPARLVADRVHPLALPWNATDPDGDPLVLSWRLANASGASPEARFDALGEHALALEAVDSHGARAEARLTVEVVNLPPLLSALRLPAGAAAGVPFAFSVTVADEDGPLPEVSWAFGERRHEGVSGNLSLPAGAHAVVVTATDADGARRQLEATLHVNETPTPIEDLERPALVVPSVEDLAARLDGTTLLVTFAAPPPGALARVSWESDAGAGERETTGGLVEVPLAAREARVRVEVRLGALQAVAETTARRLAAPEPLAPPVLRAPPQARADEPVALSAAPVADASGYQFDLGDGTRTPWLASPAVEHRWARPGAYDVRLVARAEDGRTSTGLLQVAVLPAPQPPASDPQETTMPETPAPSDAAESDALIPAALPGQEPPRREAPMPGALGALLGAALLLRLGRRAA